MTPKLVRVFAFFQPYCKTDARCRRNSENFRKLASDLPQLPCAAAERREVRRVSLRRCRTEKPDHQHRRLLRARRERPRSRTAQQRDELAPSHCVPLDSGTHAEYLGALGAIAAWFFRKWNWASFRPVGSGQH